MGDGGQRSESRRQSAWSIEIEPVDTQEEYAPLSQVNSTGIARIMRIGGSLGGLEGKKGRW